MKYTQFVTTIAVLGLVMTASVAHADFTGAVGLMPATTVTVMKTGVAELAPAAGTIPAVTETPVAVTNEYEAVPGADIIAVSTVEPGIVAAENDMPIYPNFPGGGQNVAMSSDGNQNQDFETNPSPDVPTQTVPETGNEQSSGGSSGGSSSHHTHVIGSMKKTDPVIVYQAVPVSVAYAPLPIIPLEEMVTIPEAPAHYEASVRGIQIGVSLTGILAIILAFMAAVIGYREYTFRKQMTHLPVADMTGSTMAS